MICADMVMEVMRMEMRIIRALPDAGVPGMVGPGHAALQYSFRIMKTYIVV